MNVEETLMYLREKGEGYIEKGNRFDDPLLIEKGIAYLEIVNELEQRVP